MLLCALALMTSLSAAQPVSAGLIAGVDRPRAPETSRVPGAIVLAKSVLPPRPAIAAAASSVGCAKDTSPARAGVILVSKCGATPALAVPAVRRPR
jgi:hypothetical protein